MKAYRLIMSHFSQRYPKLPKFNDSFNDSTCISFDMMRINFSDLKNLPTINPILEKLFLKEIEKEESKKLKSIK